MQTLKIDGKEWVLCPRKEFDELVQRAKALPANPKLLDDGTLPALPAMDASIARTIIQRRIALGWSQQDLAKRAGVRFETISRLESCKHIPRIETIERIDAAFNAFKPKKKGAQPGNSSSRLGKNCMRRVHHRV